MKNMTAAQVTAKWNTRAGAATPDWVAGINGVTQAPGPAAAAAVEVWAANTLAAKAKFVAKLGNQSLQEWKSQAVAKGQNNYATGVTAGQTKYQAAMGKVLAAEAQIVGNLPARGNLQANIQRSVAFQTQMAQAAQSGAFS